MPYDSSSHVLTPRSGRPRTATRPMSNDYSCPIISPRVQRLVNCPSPHRGSARPQPLDCSTRPMAPPPAPNDYPRLLRRPSPSPSTTPRKSSHRQRLPIPPQAVPANPLLTTSPPKLSRFASSRATSQLMAPRHVSLLATAQLGASQALPRDCSPRRGPTQSPRLPSGGREQGQLPNASGGSAPAQRFPRLFQGPST
jgi:hypothetical protein